MELQSVDNDIHKAYDDSWDFPDTSFESIFDQINDLTCNLVYDECRWSSRSDWATKNVHKK